MDGDDILKIADPQTSSRPQPTWTSRILGFFSSIWVGVFWLLLLFVYCSIGSAAPQVRQNPLLEMTEFEWFHWWPFNWLIVLFCLSLIIVTIRRIPLRLVNSGVWLVHAGIIILCIGSYVYFGTKVEGDAPIFRRSVRIELPGLDRPHQLVALSGAKSHVVVGAEQWHFAVQSTNTSWPILSGEDVGKTAHAVNVKVTPPVGDPFVRMLLAGYPQYTEDIIPGQGRAIKATGKKLVDESLMLSLEYEPQDYFHLHDSWALFVRKEGDSEWTQRTIGGLPRYHDHVSSREQVITDAGYPVTPRRLDLEVSPAPGGDALSDAAVRITGYLRYAHMEQRLVDGGDQVNPVVRVRFLMADQPGNSYELVAFDSARNTLEGGLGRFVWANSAAEIEALPSNPIAVLGIEIPGRTETEKIPITADRVVGREGEFTPMEGTDLAYRIINVHDNLSLPGADRSVSVAMVEIRTPEASFTRMVADQPHMTRDMHGDMAGPHGTGKAAAPRTDPRVTMTYQPRSAPLVLAAHPGGLHLAYNGSGGPGIRRSVRPGDVVELMPGLNVRIESYIARAAATTKPRIVSPPARQRNVGEAFAMIRLEVDAGSGLDAQWVPFNRYVFPNAQYAYQGRFSYSPRKVRLADGSRVEVVFSRERRRLPASVTLEDFALDTHVGGYSGEVSTIRNYVSRLRFRDDGGWTEPKPIQVNAPTEHAGYWFFQSTWDRPPQQDPNGGMNYTGVGVGNRNGVYTQLFGCCVSVAGMIFAFYIKPGIQRRKRERLRAAMGTRKRETVGAQVEESVAEVAGASA